MTRYDQLLAEGRAMTQAQLDEALKRLAMHPHFAALIAVVRKEWEGFAREASQREVVAVKGRVEHCNGSAYGVECVEGILRKSANAAAKRSDRS